MRSVPSTLVSIRLIPADTVGDPEELRPPARQAFLRNLQAAHHPPVSCYTCCCCKVKSFATKYAPCMMCSVNAPRVRACYALVFILLHVRFPEQSTTVQLRMGGFLYSLARATPPEIARCIQIHVLLLPNRSGGGYSSGLRASGCLLYAEPGYLCGASLHWSRLRLYAVPSCRSNFTCCAMCVAC